MTKIALPKDNVDSLAGNMLDAVQSFLQDKYGIECHPYKMVTLISFMRKSEGPETVRSGPSRWRR
jgi:hypothetical protein